MQRSQIDHIVQISKAFILDRAVTTHIHQIASDEYFTETQEMLKACNHLQNLSLIDHSVTDPILALDEVEYRKKKNLPPLEQNQENTQDKKFSQTIEMISSLNSQELDVRGYLD